MSKLAGKFKIFKTSWQIGKIITTPRIKLNYQSATVTSATPIRERAKSTNANIEKSE